jgi:5-methylcytosine-specific restriction endonuclease McrA
MVQRIIATPPWVCFVEIRKVYKRAAELETLTGVPHQVDHIVPLNHPRVCGLHVHWNLRAIPAGPNMSKGNYWCPEQIELFDGPEQLRLI